MRNAVIAYVSSLASFLVLDAIWLGTMASRVYKPLMGDLVLDRFLLLPAVLFYLIYGVGLVVFGVQSGLTSGRPVMALVYGGLFGLIAYATYDLTNQATLKNWPVTITVLDMAWGMIASAIAAYVGTLVTLWFTNRG
ncbi:DUF2177 family protein [Rhizobium alvei]|uniref:DUF2177 family protein n=1 Tax=Rhizobium alvei TaxID=1132659 RepID=A0ABT8YLX4_9HYPH|nr:DUF2177 family protein [Rhizobium alvei]MDO6964343.1 DUF2177 family protein [Rhizobium alvei]